MKMGKTCLMTGLVITAILIAPTASSTRIFTGAFDGWVWDAGENDMQGDWVYVSLAAKAVFDWTLDGKLQVVLTNTSSADVVRPLEVLTAVFFGLDEGISLTPISALLTEGSEVLFAPSGYENDPDVGAEWAYLDWIPNFVPPSGDLTNRGISSVGFDPFGPNDRFDRSRNLQGPDAPDGLQYGITSAGDDPNLGNDKVTGSDALIKNSVTFLFASQLFDLNLIENVWFQYGTGICEPSYPGEIWVPGGPDPTPPGEPVPEPATVFLVGLSLLGLVARKRWMS